MTDSGRVLWNIREAGRLFAAARNEMSGLTFALNTGMEFAEALSVLERNVQALRIEVLAHTENPFRKNHSAKPEEGAQS